MSDFSVSRRCLICGMDKSKKGVPCKLCGIRSENPHYYKRLQFCCDACASNYRAIIRKTPVSGREEIMQRVVVI